MVPRKSPHQRRSTWRRLGIPMSSVSLSSLFCGHHPTSVSLFLTVLVTIIDAQWEGMGDVGSARYEPALLPPCPTIRVLSYSN